MASTKILILICSALFAILGLYLLVGKRRSRSNTFLGIFFLLWAFNFLDGWLLMGGFYLRNPSLALWEDVFIFLHGPVIYLYVRSLSGKKSESPFLYILNAIPFFLALLLSFVFFHLESQEVKLMIIKSMIREQQPLQVIIPLTVTFIHVFIYIILSKRLITNLSIRLHGYYSNSPIKWFNDTLNFIIGILLLSLGVTFVQYFSNPIFFQLGLFLLNISILVFIIRIYFQTLDEPKLLDTRKISNPNLESEELQLVATRIREEMENSRTYLKSELTIDDLSKSINLEPRIVSQAINTIFQKNFFDYINSLRIEEAKKKFDENNDDKLTVLEVMYSVGFNSKSSFNTQFKKKTGLTPSQYKNNPK
ncbi:MAG: AraC family transcriptional regulator [bacterium]|nr:AraC family transcriptional regulator [bacterium]